MEQPIPAAPPVAVSPPVAYPTIKESWGILGWYLLVVAAVAMPFILLQKVFGLDHPATGLVLVCVANAALLLFLRWKAGARWQPLRVRGHEQLWLYAALPALVLATALVLSLLGLLHLPQLFPSRFPRLMAQMPVLTIIVGCVIVPIQEELLSRGIILQGLLRRYRPGVAIGLSALLFGILHLNPSQVINALLFGLLLGWLYYRTRSLLLCMAIHMLYNALAFSSIVPSLNLTTTTGALKIFGSWWGYAGAVALAGLVLAGILWRVRQTTTVEKVAPVT